MKRLLTAVIAACLTTPAFGAAPATQPATAAPTGAAAKSPAAAAPMIPAQPCPQRRAMTGSHEGQGMWQREGNPAFQHEPVKMEKAAYLGVSVRPITDQALRDQLNIPAGMGLIVEAVEPGSPADAAGIKTHDILLKLGDQELISPRQLAVLIRDDHAGENVSLTVLHDGKTTTVAATLSEKEVPALAMFGAMPGFAHGFLFAHGAGGMHRMERGS